MKPDCFSRLNSCLRRFSSRKTVQSGTFKNITSGQEKQKKHLLLIILKRQCGCVPCFVLPLHETDILIFTIHSQGKIHTGAGKFIAKEAWGLVSNIMRIYKLNIGLYCKKMGLEINL